MISVAQGRRDPLLQAQNKQDTNLEAYRHVFEFRTRSNSSLRRPPAQP